MIKTLGNLATVNAGGRYAAQKIVDECLAHSAFIKVRAYGHAGDIGTAEIFIEGDHLKADISFNESAAADHIKNLEDHGIKLGYHYRLKRDLYGRYLSFSTIEVVDYVRLVQIGVEMPCD